MLRVEADRGVVRLTLDRPDRRNALSLELLGRLGAALDAVAADPTARAVVLAATGPAFSAGHDLSEMVGRPDEEYETLFNTCSDIMLRLRRLPVPVIARVQGAAVAAGCQLVAACDLAVASEGATFATPGVKIGLFCTTPMVPIVRAIAPRAALEMLLTGAPITASRARELGLVNRVVPADRLDAAVAELTDAIGAVSPVALRIGKAAFYETLPLDEAAAYRRASSIMAANALEADAQEGMAAFLEKRPPRWCGP
ncbi:MAG TPA: enoyl-CoA hydratase [Isosphaeraceae bacterium]|jgi:enoyl-CoA hydratase/carnithine racemase|nr:enoyl-CoA hydratase [Isosphaeraceae bacterium]